MSAKACGLAFGILAAAAGIGIAHADAPCGSSQPLQVQAGERQEVLRQSADFLVKEESIPEHPYWPGGISGITLGVGWDAGQHTKDELAATWRKLSPEDIAKLQQTSKRAGADAQRLLPWVKEIVIPKELSLEVLREGLRKDDYPAVAKLFPGFEALPTGAQVALISVIFNRGGDLGHEPDWATAKEVDRRWELREFQDDVKRGDLFAIYAHLDTMKRLWESRGPKGLLLRRRDEGALVRPYALAEVRWEEQQDRVKASGSPPCAERKP